MDAYRMSLASDWLNKCKKLFKRSADEDVLHERAEQTDATNTGNIFLSQEWTGFHLRKMVHQLKCMFLKCMTKPIFLEVFFKCCLWT